MTKDPRYINLDCTFLKTKIMLGANLSIFQIRRIILKLFWHQETEGEKFNKKLQRTILEVKSGVTINIHYRWLNDPMRPDCEEKLLDILFIRRV